MAHMLMNSACLSEACSEEEECRIGRLADVHTYADKEVMCLMGPLHMP